jgi:hypothetical protein
MLCYAVQPGVGLIRRIRQVMKIPRFTLNSALSRDYITA